MRFRDKKQENRVLNALEKRATLRAPGMTDHIGLLDAVDGIRWRGGKRLLDVFSMSEKDGICIGSLICLHAQGPDGIDAWLERYENGKD